MSASLIDAGSVVEAKWRECPGHQACSLALPAKINRITVVGQFQCSHVYSGHRLLLIDYPFKWDPHTSLERSKG